MVERKYLKIGCCLLLLPHNIGIGGKRGENENEQEIEMILSFISTSELHVIQNASHPIPTN